MPSILRATAVVEDRTRIGIDGRMYFLDSQRELWYYRSVVISRWTRFQVCWGQGRRVRRRADFDAGNICGVPVVPESEAREVLEKEGVPYDVIVLRCFRIRAWAEPVMELCDKVRRVSSLRRQIRRLIVQTADFAALGTSENLSDFREHRLSLVNWSSP